MPGPKKERVLCSVPAPLYLRAEREATRRGTSVPAVLMAWAERGEVQPNTLAPTLPTCPFTAEPVADGLLEAIGDAAPFAFAPAPGRKV